MLIDFFMMLRKERLPVSFTELFTLLECLKRNIISVISMTFIFFRACVL